MVHHPRGVAHGVLGEMMDRWDTYVALPTTLVVETEELVSDLWARRVEHYVPHKKHLAERHLSAFEDLVRKWHTDALHDVRFHPYWEYIKGYHKSWAVGGDRAETGMLRMVKDGYNLYNSIKKEGMRNPLCAIFENGSRYLYRGWRRLVILHVLGITKARVANAIVDHHPGA